jgi:hypothetical protein
VRGAAVAFCYKRPAWIVAWTSAKDSVKGDDALTRLENLGPFGRRTFCDHPPTGLEPLVFGVSQGGIQGIGRFMVPLGADLSSLSRYDTSRGRSRMLGAFGGFGDWCRVASSEEVDSLDTGSICRPRWANSICQIMLEFALIEVFDIADGEESNVESLVGDDFFDELGCDGEAIED